MDDRQGGSSSQSFPWNVANPIPPSPADNFAFDSFTNQALSGFVNDNERFGLVDRYEFREVLLSSRLYRLAPEPIMAGYGAPGSILVGRIYDSSGALVGESSTTVNTAGNWIMQFFGVTAHANTHVVIEHVSSEQIQHDNVHHFRLTGDTYRSLQLGATHQQAYNIGSILADAPSTSLQAAVWENLQPLLLM